MRIIIQRVTTATLTIHGQTHAQIGPGLLILIGITHTDTPQDAQWLAAKTLNLRIFPDHQGIMNRSLLDTHGQILIVSQFTLHASTRKGNRPSWINAAPPHIALPLYQHYIDQIQATLPTQVQTGTFGADMQIRLVNDGPVTIVIDSKQRE